MIRFLWRKEDSFFFLHIIILRRGVQNRPTIKGQPKVTCLLIFSSMFSASLARSTVATRSSTLNPEGPCAVSPSNCKCWVVHCTFDAYHVQARLQKQYTSLAFHIVDIWNIWGWAENILYMTRPWAARVCSIVIWLIHLDQSIAIQHSCVPLSLFFASI